MPAYEVEEKFGLDGQDMAELEHKLRKIGFHLEREFTITDWYYDNLDTFSLLRRDCWLRCRRNENTEEWQLKIGRNNPPGKPIASERATVYEEFEGTKAIEVAAELVGKDYSSIPASSRGELLKFSDPAPKASVYGLDIKPFAKIVTERTRWKIGREKQGNKFCDLAVDVDVTQVDDQVYAIVEVEAIVEKEEDINNVRILISELIEVLNVSSSGIKVDGKLAYYMKKKLPEVFEMYVDYCVLGKVIK